MKRISISAIIFFLVIGSGSAQIDFQKDALYDIPTDKPIFVDVYTTWCGPCKKLDKTTFQDPAVSQFINDNFTAVKWDAEDIKYRHLAKKFEVRAYPTFLFLNDQRELVSKSVGFKNAEELSIMAEEVLDYLKSEPLQSDDITTLSYDDSRKELSRLTQFENPNKKELLTHLIKQLGEDEVLWEENTDLIALNANNEIEWAHLTKLIDHVDPPNVFGKRSLETAMKVEGNIGDILSHKMVAAKKSADYPLFDRVIRSKALLASNVNPNQNESDRQKSINTDRLEYYSYNKVKEHYKPLADSMIAEFIMPYSPEHVRNVDERTANFTNKLMESNPDGQDTQIDTTSIQYYKSQHNGGQSIADRLEDVAKNIMTIYDDQESLTDALNYVTLAYDYLQIPELLVTKAKVQFKLSDDTGAIETLHEAKNHRFYSSQKGVIDQLLKKFDN